MTDPTTPAASVGGLALSTPGKRFGAMLLDGVLAVVTLGIGWLIWSFVLWGKGQSPAKKLMKMRVVMSDGSGAAPLATMALRELVYKGILSSITFGITTLVGGVMVLGATHEGLWDKIAKTIVVEDPNESLG